MSNSKSETTTKKKELCKAYRESPKRFFPVVLIFEGVIYRLVKQLDLTENNPCRFCDLRELCTVNGYLSELCTSDNRDDAWHFVEDWLLADTQLNSFVHKVKE